MIHPYSDLPAKAFWKTAVADREMLDISSVWAPKSSITEETRIATFGSCFAQHFGRELRSKKYHWLNGEKAPQHFAEEEKQLFNYERFSARTGNIYTTSLLRQWVSWAAGESVPPDEVWQDGDRFFDPFRPNIEPSGFESRDEVVRSRAVTINALQSVIKKANVFVFTLGLTESWLNEVDGFEYPLCPGTVAGTFDEAAHTFLAQDYEYSLRHLHEALATMRRINHKLNVLLTVSPVPLTATKTGQHVLVSTSASKAILRAVAETVSNRFEFVDYFPSYELINSPVFKGAFFEENLRSVTRNGVDFVMKTFFESLQSENSESRSETRGSAKIEAKTLKAGNDEIACDEELLSTYAPTSEDKN